MNAHDTFHGLIDNERWTDGQCVRLLFARIVYVAITSKPLTFLLFVCWTFIPCCNPIFGLELQTTRFRRQCVCVQTISDSVFIGQSRRQTCTKYTRFTQNDAAKDKNHVIAFIALHSLEHHQRWKAQSFSLRNREFNHAYSWEWKMGLQRVNHSAKQYSRIEI